MNALRDIFHISPEFAWFELYFTSLVDMLNVPFVNVEWRILWKNQLVIKLEMESSCCWLGQSLLFEENFSHA
jgi:hypothetical protein